MFTNRLYKACQHVNSSKTIRFLINRSIVQQYRVPKKNFKYININERLILRNASSEATYKKPYPLQIYIGSISKEIQEPKTPAFIPTLYYENNISQTELNHLRWMLKKDLLGQDMFLIGPPGPSRRHLAMAFAELTHREVEYLSLSRDTTESDMKQRREVISKTAQYIDQSAVRAAVEGRLLIIEGIEKAERNVLPLLNNLLENREMHLEDGRHLISSSTFDKLYKEHGSEALERWKLVRVNKNFRVIALGLPVPFFKGNPLDPPLRSRFQGRSIVPLTTTEMLIKLRGLGPDVPMEKLKTLNNFAYSVIWSNDPDFKKSEDNPWAISLPHFPLENLSYGAALLNKDPDIPLDRLLLRMYPYDLLLEKEEGQLNAVQESLPKYGIEVSERKKRKVKKMDGDLFIPIDSHQVVIDEMIQSHSIRRDVCLVGSRGTGKSVIVSKFAKSINSKVEPIVMYKDMTARDLLQQRATKSDGDTIWLNAPLVQAALDGKLALLDGLDQVHSSTLSVIFRLVHDRELQLHDGSRLLRSDRYDAIKEKYSLSDQEMKEKHLIQRIHPDFYIVATGIPPPKSSTSSGGPSGKGKSQWLTPEILSLFFYHKLPDMTLEEELSIIQSFCEGKISREMKRIVEIARELRESSESSKKSLASSLSTRQLIRIAKRSEKFGKSDKEIGPFEEITRACLSRFLPSLNKDELEGVIKRNGILPLTFKNTAERKIDISNGKLTIGHTVADIWTDTQYESKVPYVLFYNIQQHIRALEELLQNYLMGEHLLLVGNQGVGKNKLVDQLLFLLNRPREYIQLHRDTTVQALTLQQKVIDGVVTFEDSPLVRAARDGHVIIIDEADKAPTHVTSILKTLAESGEMILSDGRRIVPMKMIEDYYKDADMKNIIPLHPNFRMFVLANRPGFPFLGNDFYSVLGDLFSVHAIDNPSYESEMELLKGYGPSISEDYLARIAKAFGALRNLADEGTIPYPYSTREAVSIVKHLEKYPNDSLADAIDNVFDFDVYNSELRQTVKETLKKFNLEPTEGILLRRRSSITDDKDLEVHLVPVSEIPEFMKRMEMTQMSPLLESSRVFKESDFQAPKIGKFDATNAPHVGGNQWAGGSGGQATAGLGGAGGPFRLDSGNPVFQVADAVKQAVPPEVRKMARAMAMKAFEERLQQIRMSKYEGNIYEQYLNPIRPQIQALRVILNSLQAKAKERKWVKHQTSGEIDDSKLIESVVGEKAIYKRRKEEDPEPGDPQDKPKKLKLVVDCSGSMYRFNGYDRRMDRMLECALLVMESFKDYEDIFQYEIIGHSGDDWKLPLVEFNSVPKSDKDRIDIMKMMHLHSQFCASGDNTLEATEDAIKKFADDLEDTDEAFVIVLSDANLDRYGISPKELSKILNMNSEIKAFAIFVGSLGDQAQRLAKELPAGKGFVCLDTSKLPQILQRIFTQTILT